MPENTAYRIVWHIGPQKTGTRTIQTWINENKAAFEEHAALFTKHNNTQKLENAGKKIMRPGRFLRMRQLRWMRLRWAVNEVRHAATRHPKRIALVSNENIIGHWIWHQGVSVFDEAETIIPLLARFSRPAQSHFVFYTRSMGPWLTSAWRQEVMTRRCTKDLDAWRAALPFQEDWVPIKARLNAAAQAAGAEISFGDFDAEVAAGRLGSAVLTEISAATDFFETIPQSRSQNKGAGANATEFMLRLNRTEIDSAAREIVRRTVEENRRLFLP